MSAFHSTGMEVLIQTGDIPKLNHSHTFSVRCAGPAQPAVCLICRFAMKRRMFGAVVVDMIDTFHLRNQMPFGLGV